MVACECGFVFLCVLKYVCVVGYSCLFVLVRVSWRAFVQVYGCSIASVVASLFGCRPYDHLSVSFAVCVCVLVPLLVLPPFRPRGSMCVRCYVCGVFMCVLDRV